MVLGQNSGGRVNTVNNSGDQGEKRERLIRKLDEIKLQQSLEGKLIEQVLEIVQGIDQQSVSAEAGLDWLPEPGLDPTQLLRSVQVFGQTVSALAELAILLIDANDQVRMLVDGDNQPFVGDEALSGLYVVLNRLTGKQLESPDVSAAEVKSVLKEKLRSAQMLGQTVAMAAEALIPVANDLGDSSEDKETGARLASVLSQLDVSSLMTTADQLMKGLNDPDRLRV